MWSRSRSDQVFSFIFWMLNGYLFEYNFFWCTVTPLIHAQRFYEVHFRSKISDETARKGRLLAKESQYNGSLYNGSHCSDGSCLRPLQHHTQKAYTNVVHGAGSWQCTSSTKHKTQTSPTVFPPGEPVMNNNAKLRGDSWETKYQLISRWDILRL